MEQPADYASGFFLDRYGIDYATLLAPICDEAPQGTSLRGTSVWQAIRRARESDDASLPLGAWIRRLKRASWSDVAYTALDALATRTKDLQLAVWLAEALLHEHGFAGLAAGITVIDGLSERYWETLYPSLTGNLEHRANLIHWFNEKLLAPVRLVPITVPPDAESAAEGARSFGWAHCEYLRRQQQTEAALPEPAAADTSGASGIDVDEFADALAATPDDALRGTLRDLEQALVALDGLDATLERCFRTDAPSVGALHTLLETICAFAGSELRRRGIEVEWEPSERGASLLPLPSRNEAGVAAATAARHAAAAAAAAIADATAATAGSSGGASASFALQDREPSTRMRAYAQLAEAAATLAEIEPHSPVPYLVRKAVQWGALNTAQLYEELFVLGRGRLSVFEMLGIDRSETSEGTS